MASNLSQELTFPILKRIAANLDEKQPPESVELILPVLAYIPTDGEARGEIVAAVAVVNRTARADVALWWSLGIMNDDSEWTERQPNHTCSISLEGFCAPQPPYIVRAQEDNVQLVLLSFDAPYLVTATLFRGNCIRARLRVRMIRCGEIRVDGMVQPIARVAQRLESELLNAD